MPPRVRIDTTAAALVFALCGCHPKAVEDPLAGEPPTHQAVRSAVEQLEKIDHHVDISRFSIETQPAQSVAEGLELEIGSSMPSVYFDAMLVARGGVGLPLDFSSGDALLAQVAAETAAGRAVYYDAARRSVVFRADADVDPWSPDLFEALVHAYLDQNLGGLTTGLLGADGGSDQARARRCVVEGHAQFVARAMALQKRGLPPEHAELEEFPDAESSVAAEANLRCPAGARMMLSLFETGGWGAVLAAVSNAPSSTEVVRHPIKKDADFPTNLGLPSWDEAKLGPATLLGEDTLGETNIYRLLREAGLAAETASLAATGWDGDRLALYELPNGERVLIWRTLWDRDDDAFAFQAALGKNPRTDRSFRVFYSGREVQAIVSSDEQLAIGIRGLLGNEPQPLADDADAKSTAAEEAKFTAAKAPAQGGS